MSDRNSPARQRLILLFDGTWNDHVDRTNVYRLCRSIADFDESGIRQRFFYHSGVGTSRFDRVRGGAFGRGLMSTLMSGYDWLSRRYAEGDEIFIFGFSRGAFTARSLSGLIRKCGLMHIVTDALLKDAAALYRNRSEHPDSESCREFREAYSRHAEIDFLGVWDTVGSLGIPKTRLSERALLSWHDTELSSLVRRACQAMALDEHRDAYDIVFWSGPEGKKKSVHIDVEQRWFIGAHADVGGGYREQKLADLSLVWMQKKAAEAGLCLHPLCEADEKAHMQDPADSYSNFLYGFYRILRSLTFRGRYYRPFDSDRKGNKAVNITVDGSVWRRWNENPAWRPPTLVRAGISPPEKVVGN